MAYEEQEARPPWRGWHVIGRFLPMIALGLIFVVYGLSPVAPHKGALRYGEIFVWVGGILLIGAVLGMLFTKCPTCYQTKWIYCAQEPDIVRQRDRHGSYYERDLAYPSDEE
jgi:hypothetical protein